jgi:hypothetical protein
MSRTITESLLELAGVKQDLVDQLTEKGIELSGEESFGELATLVETIETGIDTTVVLIGKNLLTENQSDVETDTTGFEALNGTVLTQDLVEHMEGGLASLKAVIPEVPDAGLKIDVSQVINIDETPNTFSFYVKGEEGTLSIRLAYSNTYSDPVEVIVTEEWTRHSISYEFADFEEARLQILGYGQTIYLDHLKFEAGTEMTEWNLGGQLGVYPISLDILPAGCRGFVNGELVEGVVPYFDIMDALIGDVLT